MTNKTGNGKIVHVALKAILSLIFILPILGATGIFPKPTREFYNTDAAFNFIQTLTQDASYIQYVMAITFFASIVLLWTGREAFAALLITPITVNIVGFHLFLDGGLLMGGSIMANILLLLNIYFLWSNRKLYNTLLQKSAQ